MMKNRNIAMQLHKKKATSNVYHQTDEYKKTKVVEKSIVVASYEDRLIHTTKKEGYGSKNHEKWEK